MRTKAALVYEYKKPLVIDELTLGAPKDREVLISIEQRGYATVSLREGWRLSHAPLPCVPTRRGGCRSGCGHG